MLLWGLAGVIMVSWTPLVGATATTPKRPNIVFILADDWGWGDVGAYGAADTNYHMSGTMVQTPRLDKLAKEGTLFTDFHVAQSFCAPSRTSFMTGRFPADLRVNTNWNEGRDGWEDNEKVGLPYQIDPNLPNVANLLRGGGYKTAHFGKWHLGGVNPPSNRSSTPLPSDYGFDLTGTYASPVQTNQSWVSHINQLAMNSSDPWESADVGNYITNSAIQFMKNSVKENKPFYINLWYHMSHNTIDPPPQWLTPYPYDKTCLFMAKQAGQTICPSQIYWGAQTASDARFGEVLDAIDSLGISEDTLVVFSTDNGAQGRGWTDGKGGVFDNAVGVQGPFRGCKASLYEGGHRVPFIARWPGHIPVNRIDHSLIGSVDWLPTLLKLSKTTPSIPIPDLKGEDISDIILGKVKNKMNRGKPLMWRGGGGPPPCWNRSPGLAIRRGDWKLLVNPDGSRVELYNVSVGNLGDGFFESQNEALGNEDVVESLRKEVMEWHHSIPPERPGATDKSQSVFGCSQYKFPGR